jgi:hypothetical protein
MFSLKTLYFHFLQRKNEFEFINQEKLFRSLVWFHLKILFTQKSKLFSTNYCFHMRNNTLLFLRERMKFHEKHAHLTFLSYGINKDDINILQTKKRTEDCH